jgi:hypothetical protein
LPPRERWRRHIRYACLGVLHAHLRDDGMQFVGIILQISLYFGISRSKDASDTWAVAVRWYRSKANSILQIADPTLCA